MSSQSKRKYHLQLAASTLQIYHFYLLKNEIKTDRATFYLFSAKRCGDGNIPTTKRKKRIRLFIEGLPVV